MNAAVVHSFDAPPRYTSFPDPVPAEDELLVHVVAAGLHPIVKALARGSHYLSRGVLPFVPGLDGVGKQQNGTRIYFGRLRAPFGTFCERSVTRASMCIPVPDELDSVTAAAIANPGMSSWVALTSRAHFVSGENVVILGATGTAGQLAVQIAKHLGARRIVAAGRNRAVLEKLREDGADAIVALDQGHESLVTSFHRELEPGGIDVVLDYVWGPPAEALLAAIAQKGREGGVSRIRFMQIGEEAGKTISLPAATLRSTGIELLGSGFGSASIDQIFEALAKFFLFATDSRLKINTRPVPLRDVEAVWNSGDRSARFVFLP